jgi:hypothetical protein
MLRRVRAIRSVVVALVFAAVLATVVAVAPSSSSASLSNFRLLATECEGTAVKRCSHIWWAATSNRIWGNIWIEDNQSDRTNYSVSVNRATVQYWTGSGWKNHEVAKDYDGWHGVTDQVYTPYAACVPGRTYRVLYYAQWRLGRSVAGTWETTKTVTCPQAV